MATFPDDIVEQTTSWLSRISQSDDRLLIIIGATKLEELLTDLLKAVMIHDPGDDDRLFGHERPLGTFSAKIVLAYRLGLIDRTFEKFLQQLRKLRNSAAHSAEPIDLSVSPYVDRVTELFGYASKSPAHMAAFAKRRPVVVREQPGFAVYLSLLVSIFCCEAAKFRARYEAPEPICHFGNFEIAGDGGSVNTESP